MEHNQSPAESFLSLEVLVFYFPEVKEQKMDGCLKSILIMYCMKGNIKASSWRYEFITFIIFIISLFGYLFTFRLDFRNIHINRLLILILYKFIKYLSKIFYIIHSFLFCKEKHKKQKYNLNSSNKKYGLLYQNSIFKYKCNIFYLQTWSWVAS